MCRRRSKSSVDSIRLLHDYITENVSEPTPESAVRGGTAPCDRGCAARHRVSLAVEYPTFCEAIELCRNVSALVELDWLSGVVSDAHQLAAQGMNRLNVLHVNAKGTGLGQSILDKVKRCTDRAPLRHRRLCRLRIRHHRRAGRVLGG